MRTGTTLVNREHNGFVHTNMMVMDTLICEVVYALKPLYSIVIQCSFFDNRGSCFLCNELNNVYLYCLCQWLYNVLSLDNRG